MFIMKISEAHLIFQPHFIDMDIVGEGKVKQLAQDRTLY